MDRRATSSTPRRRRWMLWRPTRKVAVGGMKNSSWKARGELTGATSRMRLQQPFPTIYNMAAPNPSSLWCDDLRRPPLPTNSAWQNFVINEGSIPEYIHPYLIQSKLGALSICYPARVANSAFIFQAFVPNLTISSGEQRTGKHVVSYYDDLSVTLELPGQMTVPLVRGSPYITCIFSDWVYPILSTIHVVLKISSNKDCTKHKILLNNGQIWLVYSSVPFDLSSKLGFCSLFKGVIRISLLVGDYAGEEILDRFCSTYPSEGHADLSIPFQVTYEWKTNGLGELLMLSLPLHRELLSFPSEQSFFPALSYTSIDGPLLAVVGDSWVMDETPFSVGWYSLRGIYDLQAQRDIAVALRWDVACLQRISTDSIYFHGKALARAARMALIAEEISLHEVITSIRDFLIDSITPWMEGSFPGNAFVYDEKWGGLISRKGAYDSRADFGLGVYNDHHYHLGYFCYAGAVLAKLDPCWGNAYRAHLYAIVEDYMTLRHHHFQDHLHSNVHQHLQRKDTISEGNALFPRLRNFDLWALHSWGGGLIEFDDGRNQESTSEAVNAYYSAALLGLAFGDTHLINAGLTLAALEIRAARTLWHIPSFSSLYEPEFTARNRMMGVLWANKRDTGLWFAPADWKECRLGIQILPILPITEFLFQDLNFVQELVQWTWPALARHGVGEGWKGFVYALQAFYSPEDALRNVLALQQHDDGNSLTNLLWWIFSRWPISHRY